MKPENAIEVHNITKKFKVFFDKGHTLKEFALFSHRRRYEERLVLKGISFEVKKGEAIGLIGNNGCGKSTTLKLLTRIMYPDSGTIEMCGRVSSLLELGAGFHPDMSGRQNIYTNASIFGLTKKEIDARLEKIIEFSELQDFIDNPVRTYSSGMYMRLAFAVAINVDADILLIDEILAVGDAKFQTKCFNKLKEIKAQGTTIVIVSHSMEQIERICERSIWIKDGVIKAEGDPERVDQLYLEFMESDASSLSSRSETGMGQNSQNVSILEKKVIGDCKTEIVNINCTDLMLRERYRFYAGEIIVFNIEYRSEKPDEEIDVGIGISKADEKISFSTSAFADMKKLVSVKSQGTMQISIKSENLYSGTYYADFTIADRETRGSSMGRQVFEIVSEKGGTGEFYIPHTWKLDERIVYSDEDDKINISDLL